jgi:hypothetical protein
MSARNKKTLKVRLPGRSLLCDELEERLCGFLRQALAIEVACDLTPIGRRTYYDWKERGEKEEQSGKPGRYAQFNEAVRRAEAEAIAELTGQVRKSNPQWLLERRWPAMFGQKVKAELSGPDGEAISMKIKPVQVIIRDAGTSPERSWEIVDHADID